MMGKHRTGTLRLAGVGTLTVALALLSVSAQAVPAFFNNEAAYLAALGSIDFTIDVGRDNAGNPLPAGTRQHNGSDIFSSGIDVVFSSPLAPNPALVTTNPAHPELGPVGPGGQFWARWLTTTFDNPVTAIGFGTHLLDIFDVVLLDQAGGVLSRTPLVRGGFDFVGIVDPAGFSGFAIETNNTFWSIDGGRLPQGPGSSSQMVGQRQVAEPSTVLLIGMGLLGYAAARRRNRA